MKRVPFTYFESRKLPIHDQNLVIAKLKKMIKEGILEHVRPGGSKWTSAIAVLQKNTPIFENVW